MMRLRNFMTFAGAVACLTACPAQSNEQGSVPAPSPPVVQEAETGLTTAAATPLAPAPSTPQPQSTPRELNMISAAQQANDFATRLYAKLAAAEPGNLFFSPFSIHTALSMAYAGSRGETARQMREVLAFLYAPDEGAEHHAYSLLLDALNAPPTVSIPVWDGQQMANETRPAFDLVVANRLWGQQGFAWDNGFLHLLELEYKAGLTPVDFLNAAEPARATINDWIARTTRDRIRDLIAPGTLTPQTRLVLTNAIYFKANWAEDFPEHLTKPAPFHLAGGETAEVPMMNQKDDFGYMENERWQALDMPYERNELSMIVLLPREGAGRLTALEQEMAAPDFLQSLQSLPRPEVQVWLPKFSITQEFGLGEVLAGMGMPLAFGPEADFGHMTSEQKLWIDAVIHKAFVEVDEKGTEAAAATAVVMAGTAFMPDPEQPKTFRADRPFLFLIRHNPTGAILFSGRVMDPRGN